MCMCRIAAQCTAKCPSLRMGSPGDAIYFMHTPSLHVLSLFFSPFQSAEDGMTLSASSSSSSSSDAARQGASVLTGEGLHENISVMDSMAQIRSCIDNVHNVRDFLGRRGALRCAEECDRMLIGAIASEKRASALAVATDVANAPYRMVESIAASVLDDLVTESYEQGEELMIEKANKLWSLMLQKRLRRKRNDAHQRIVEGISDVAQETILFAMAREILSDQSMMILASHSKLY